MITLLVLLTLIAAITFYIWFFRNEGDGPSGNLLYLILFVILINPLTWMILGGTLLVSLILDLI